MRKIGRKKARVSSHHLKSQAPNFVSVTTQTACSGPFKLGFMGWEKETAGL